MREYFTFFLFFSVWVYIAAAAYPWPDKVVQEKGYINVRSFYYYCEWAWLDYYYYFILFFFYFFPSSRVKEVLVSICSTGSLRVVTVHPLIHW